MGYFEDYENMKDMVYNGSGKTELLFATTFNDVDVAIMNIRGTHPCAYIRIPDERLKNLEENGLDYYNYDNWNALVHGGFAYCGKKPHKSLRDGFWLGWDYAHLGDYYYMPPSPYGSWHDTEKKWTTEEILKEAALVILTLEFIGGDDDTGRSD